MNGNDASDRFVPVANQYLFPIAHQLQMSAELRLEVADFYATHTLSITYLTKLVMLFLVAPLQPCTTTPDDFFAPSHSAQAIRGVLWTIPNLPRASTTITPPCPLSRFFM